MKNSQSQNSNRSLSTVLYLLLASILLIPLLTGCWGNLDDADDDTSLVTGDCNFTAIQINFDQNPITVGAGEEEMLHVQVAVSGNCSDYLSRVDIDGGNPVDPDVYIWGCTNDYCSNNIGGCIIDVNVPIGTEVGTYSVEIIAEAFGGEDHDVKISGSAMLEVNVINVGDFSINAPPSIGVAQGYENEYFIDISRTGGHNTDITFSIDDYPLYVEYTFNPNPAWNAVDQVSFFVSPEINAPPGTYSIEVLATDGTIEKHDILTFYLIEPYYLTLLQEAIEIQQGQTATLEVFMNRMGGFGFDINLSAQGDIIGQGDNFVDITFDPNPADWGSSNASLAVGNSVDPGIYAVTFKGSAGSMNKYVTFELTVIE